MINYCKTRAASGGQNRTAMKPNLARAVLLAAVLILFYSACKKNTVKPAATADNSAYAKLSSQAAVMLYKAITGRYGGADVSKGIAEPFNTNGPGPKLQVFTANPLCGFISDTSYSYMTHSGGPVFDPADTIFTFSGELRFVFTCDNNKLDGYQVNDTVTNKQQSPYIINEFDVGQNYAVKTLDQTNKIVSMNGTLNSAVHLAQIIDETGSSQTAAYQLNGLVVDFTSGTADVTSGTAAFHTVVYGQHSFNMPYTPTTYDGTIQFLGNHTAKLTINPGHVYLVNLITGVATPA